MSASAHTGEQPAAPQPIATIHTATETAYTDAQSQQQGQKPRFTRAEKRQYAKEKKATHQAKITLQNGPKKPILEFYSMDNLISFLVDFRDKSIGINRRDVGRFLGARRARPLSKPVPTEKVQKLKEKKKLRQEQRKAAWEAKKAERAAQAVQVDAAPTPAPTPTLAVEQQPLPDFEDVNFDDL